jgi:predicted DNA-binding transcriptional regulator YafY
LPYLLLEWFVVNALWKGGPRRRSETGSPEPLYPEAERHRVLRSALEYGADVEIVYVAVGSGEETLRVVSPEYLWQARAGHWLLTGHDHLRGARRTFRVGSMRRASALELPSAAPPAPMP